MQNRLDNKVYAGFFVRLIAFAIDNLIAACVVGIVKFPFSIAGMSGVGFLNANLIFDYSFLDVLGYVGVAAYFVLLTYFSHSTPGKMLMRLEVVTIDKDWTFLNVLYRETVGRFLSSILCIGYLAVLLTKKKQGFHDMLCDTYVVYKNMVPIEAKRKENTIIQNAVSYHSTSPFDLDETQVSIQDKEDKFVNIESPKINEVDNVFQQPELDIIEKFEQNLDSNSDDSEEEEETTVLTSQDINE